MSPFYDSFGFYAHGVGEKTAVLPRGWKDRLIELKNENTDYRCGLCLDPYDLCVAKLYAYREKDLEYVAALLEAGLLHPEILLARLALVEPNKETEGKEGMVQAFLNRQFHL